ncbi:MAG: acyl carrier protein [Bacteroidales bacterium]|nr:acyl carrier protein [Bacteroidales bacterium]
MDENFIALINKSLEIGKDSVVLNETLQDNPRFDSLGVLMVLLMLEEEYGVIISSEDFQKFNTLEDLYQHVISNTTKYISAN